MGDFLVLIVFGVVRNLAIPILLRALFIDSFENGAFRSEWKTLPYNYDLFQTLLMIKEDMKRKGSEERNSVMMLELEDDNNQLIRVVW